MKRSLVIMSLFFVKALFAQEGGAPPKDSSVMDAFLNMFISLGVIVVLLLFAGWFLKRMLNTKMTQANQGSRIKIIERRSLAPKSNLYLLNVGGKGLLVGESAAGLHTLMELPLDEEFLKEESGEKKASTPFTFGQLMQGKFKKRS